MEAREQIYFCSVRGVTSKCILNCGPYSFHLDHELRTVRLHKDNALNFRFLK